MESRLRDDAIEECAKLVESHPDGRVATHYDWTKSVGSSLAEAIRKLKTPQTS
ncbi:hypothetical protein SAMN03159423_0212 [Bradyrhizobium sp. NFR13]|nr:hypothetical protein SAMN03159423_0212 [Bradyrhizobium sp. NFR13]